MPRVKLKPGEEFLAGIQPDPPCVHCEQVQQDFCKRQQMACRGFYNYIMAVSAKKGRKDFKRLGLPERKYYIRLYG